MRKCDQFMEKYRNVLERRIESTCKNISEIDKIFGINNGDIHDPLSYALELS